MGAGNMDYLELSEQIMLKTGGLSSKAIASEHHSDVNKLQQVRWTTCFVLGRQQCHGSAEM